MSWQLPEGWELESQHYNGQGERIGVAVYPGGHPDYGKNRLLLLWDDPPHRGPWVVAMALLDLGAVEWLQDVIGTIVESGEVQP